VSLKSQVAADCARSHCQLPSCRRAATDGGAAPQS
jgi:hypothetical protein